MECRPQIADAIAWELIWQLMRRCQERYALRVWETHPGDGQYDCLSLHTADKRTRLDFNLAGQSLHVWVKDQHVNRIDIIDKYLQCENPKQLLDRICDLAGLRHDGKLPPSNGSVLACGVIATIFRQNIFATFKLKMLMGYIDTSGYGDGPRRTKFLLFPAYAKETNFTRYFFLEKDGQTLCMIDMAGRVILLNGDEIPLEIEYANNSRDMNLLAARLSREIFA